ncbi:ribonuclease H-like domain-containing protein [Nanchangia anserum]|uniref:ribonuclease H-like domain-containing protein n=1 Tax=Nanchangia anserum TaxID=2692125 RepID=UPI0018843D76|nr:ribonuclease H-like domain-containing protein [Nanchangia anserum]QOX81786.1 ribonuclease H-like domain-containing protein [Nanchangia anserum]
MSWWAHSREQEAALAHSLISWLEARRRAYPRMRVYHYAAPEPLFIRRLANRHGIDQQRARTLTGPRGIFTDLFDVVSATVRTGQPGASLKDLEPLYMGAFHRGDLADGARSVVLYDRLRETMTTEQLEVRPDALPGVLAELAAYNEYDCVSTLGLHRWLSAQRVTQ